MHVSPLTCRLETSPQTTVDTTATKGTTAVLPPTHAAALRATASFLYYRHISFTPLL